MNEMHDKKSKLGAWLMALVLRFREKYPRLNPEKQRTISSLEDLRNPLQINAIWLIKDTRELQMIIFTHAPNPNFNIGVHGPFSISAIEEGGSPIIEQFEEVSEFLYQNDLSRVGRAQLEEYFDTNVRMIDNSQISTYPEKRMLGTEKEKAFLWTFFGNITEVDSDEVVSQILEH